MSATLVHLGRNCWTRTSASLGWASRDAVGRNGIFLVHYVRRTRSGNSNGGLPLRDWSSQFTDKTLRLGAGTWHYTGISHLEQCCKARPFRDKTLLQRGTGPRSPSEQSRQRQFSVRILQKQKSSTVCLIRLSARQCDCNWIRTRAPSRSAPGLGVDSMTEPQNRCRRRSCCDVPCVSISSFSEGRRPSLHFVADAELQLSPWRAQLCSRYRGVRINRNLPPMNRLDFGPGCCMVSSFASALWTVYLRMYHLHLFPTLTGGTISAI